MPISTILSKLWGNFLDLLFPRFCIECHREGTYLCHPCCQKIPFYLSRGCPLCESPSEEQKLCGTCRQSSQLLDLFVIASYRHPVIQKLIRAIKYDGAWTMAEDLPTLIERFFKQIPSTIPRSVIAIPIPLHKERLCERGFNQSEILAKMIAAALAIPSESRILVRRKATPSQIRLDRNERMQNLKDAFHCPNSDLVSGKRILLVDDVLTTGTTISEAARTLRAAGAQSVRAIVLAKEPLNLPTL